MKKILFFLSLLVVGATGFAENIVLMNQTGYPSKNQQSKIAVQWANSAKEVTDANNAVISGSKLNPDTMQAVTQTGKMKLNVPAKAEYFRVLAWSKAEGEPNLVTNWVEVVPNKTYTVKADHLVPAVLMAGTGC